MKTTDVTSGLGKRRGLARISDGAGRFAVLAIDQRPQLLTLVAAALGRAEEDVAAEVGDLKRLLAEVLAADVTGLLVDPTFGYGAVLPALPRATGLLLALEDSRVATDPRGYRKAALEPRWGVEAAVRAGAEALKLLIWYRPDAPEEVRLHQQSLVREVGAQCRAWDRPLVLEILPYPLPGESEETYARALPKMTLACAALCAAPDSGVDLYKLPFPGSPAGVREWGGGLYALRDLEGVMVECTRLLSAPWVILSGGMDSDHFVEAHAAALSAGARGYLAGRAIWWRAAQLYPDRGMVRDRLEGEGRSTLRRLNEALAGLPPKESSR